MRALRLLPVLLITALACQFLPTASSLLPTATVGPAVATSESATAEPGLATFPVTLGPYAGAAMEWFDSSNLVYIPPGEFTMGQEGRQDNPKHVVLLKGYWIYQAKVTNRLYASCVDAGVCTPPAPQEGSPDFRDPRVEERPVVGVTWMQAGTYCEWVHGRLPTEAEWEKAARGPDENIYPWGNNEPLCDLLNFNNCVGRITRVTTFPIGESFYGLLDMAGNAFEWVADWYQADYYGTNPAENPTGPETGEERSIRSSGFQATSDVIPSAQRSSLPPDQQRGDVGFRCVVAEPTLTPPFCEVKSSQPGSSDEGSRQTNGCDPVYYKIAGAFKQGSYSYITIDLNQAVGDPSKYNITTDGYPLTCSIVSGYPNRLSCYSDKFPLNAWVEVTICGPGCTPNSSLPTTPGVTSCPSGYTLNPLTGACIYTPPTGSGQNPQCPSGYYYDNSRQTCLPVPGGDQTPQCPEGYYYDVPQKTCTPVGNQSPDCPSGTAFTAASQTCSPVGAGCPQGQYFDTKQQICVAIPTDNQCPQGYYYDIKQRTCLPVPGGEQTPQCPQGYYFDTHQQTCMPRGDQTPGCPDGYKYQDNARACISSTGCPAGQFYDTGKQACVPVPGGTQDCPPSFTAYPGYGCLPNPDAAGVCPIGYYLDQLAKTCVPMNGPTDCTYTATNLANQTQLCYRSCPAGYAYDSNNQCCQPAGSNSYPGCPQGYYYDFQQKTCIPGVGWYPDCPNGYYFNKELKACVPEKADCTPGTYLAAASQTCAAVPGSNTCPQGYFYEENRQTCLPTAGGSQTPVCPDGYYYDPRKQSCLQIPTGDNGPQCPDGYTYDEKYQTCLPKPSGTRCLQGYFYDSNLKLCIPGKGWVTNSCVTLKVYLSDVVFIPTDTPKPEITVTKTPFCSQFKDPKSCIAHANDGCSWVYSPTGSGFCKEQ